MHAAAGMRASAIPAAARRLAMRGSASLAGRPASVSARAPLARAATLRRRRNHVLTTAGWNDFEWGVAKIVSNEPAAKEGGLRSIQIRVDAELARGYVTPGQFVQMRLAEDGKPAFLAIASPPDASADIFELLVKSTDGTAGDICALDAGAEVGVSPPMGKGFDLSAASADECPDAFLFATGSGISPVRALIKSGALEGRDVTLFYGTASPAYTAFADEFGEWEAAGVAVRNVQSRVGGPPTYVQDALKEGIENVRGEKTCAVLCGQKEMTEAVIEALVGAGVPKERCIMNF